MQSLRPTRVGSELHTAGSVTLTQGVYGARGNLELVACDAVDGLWVFWFNADLDSDPIATPDVPPGSWSAGLAFAAGHRYLDAQILQSTEGPDHLEVLALSAGGTLQSWFWSPGPGFQRRRADAATGVARFGATHERGALRLSVEDAAGARRHLFSPVRGYPAREWLRSPDGPGMPADATATLTSCGIPLDVIEPGTARAVTSSRGGGTTELTWRVPAGGIRHLGAPLL